MSETASGAAGSGDLRSERTRDAIVDAAERLYGTRGIGAVSNRQVSEAAAQGNNTAVSYHFGSKSELLRAIVRRHEKDIERRRAILLESTDVTLGTRAWVDCLVRPTANHLAALPAPTWYARLSAQMAADPLLRTLLAEEAANLPTLPLVIQGLHDSQPELPDTVREHRLAMSRQLLAYGYAERESMSRGEVAPWGDFTTNLVDALSGLWSAPWSRPAGSTSE